MYDDGILSGVRRPRYFLMPPRSSPASIEVQAFVTRRRRGFKHRGERDVGHRRKRRQEPRGWAKRIEQSSLFRDDDQLVRHAIKTKQ